MTIEQLRKKYQKNVTKKKGGVKMPRIFRFAIYLMIVLTMWKIYSNLENIVGFAISLVK